MNLKLTIFLVILSSSVYSQSRNDYTEQRGLEFLHYSKAAYCDFDSLSDWNCESCQKHPGVKQVYVYQNHLTGVQYYIGYDHDKDLIVISFKGKDNVKEWMSNMNFDMVDYPYCTDCQVNRNMYQAWVVAKDKLFENFELLQEAYPSAEILVTGHSVGGAMAVLAAIDLQVNDNTVEYMYTYGAPRIGNSAFSAFSGLKLPLAKAVIHHEDPVPHFPPRNMNYVRSPDEVWYYEEKSSKWKWCPSDFGKENSTCSNKCDQFTDLSEHFEYLGVYTGCGDKQTETGSDFDFVIDAWGLIFDE